MQKFKVSTEVCFGKDALNRLSKFQNQTIVIVTDSFLISTGLVEKVSAKLLDCKIHIFSDVVPDPPIEIVTKGVDFLQEISPDLLIAVGGGSSIDAAKSILMVYERLHQDIKLPFVAIPTTSGTGSEVTMFSVITDAKKSLKYPLVSPEILPDIAILDAEFVCGVPAQITADTGMDVITHAVEAYVSTNASCYSDALAEKALELAFAYLPLAYADGNNLEAREQMHNASCMAGIAFNAAGLGINHSIAHALGAKFHIPHGRINGILLPYTVEYNGGLGIFGAEDCLATAKCYQKLARRLGLSDVSPSIGTKALVTEIKKLQKTLKLQTSLFDVGVSRADLEAIKASIVEGALADVCTATNPRTASSGDIEKILNKILA